MQAPLVLTSYEVRIAASVFERLFPADENGPGATEIGVVAYLDRALTGAYRDRAEAYRLGLAALDLAARQRWGVSFAGCAAGEQETMIGELEAGELPNFNVPPQREFFEMLRAHLQEGLFSDPAHGGNRDKLGWRFLGHPGIWLENSAEENLAEEPVTKGGEIRSLEDLGCRLSGSPNEPVHLPGYDPQRGAEPPTGPADVVLVGVGAMGSVVAPVLARAGLRVVGLEAGPWRTRNDFLPDELGSAYYCRGEMGPKFLGETPRWRRNVGETTREATFSLGRMMNGVGGSVIHWGGALRRCHPHHFRYLTHVRESFGEKALPEGHTLVDWPVTYDELEPYYTALEYLIGVAGNDETPSSRAESPIRYLRCGPSAPARSSAGPRRRWGCTPTRRRSRSTASRTTATRRRPTAPGAAGSGRCNDERWHPGLTSVPEALATGNFDLRTHCRVVRVLTDPRRARERSRVRRRERRAARTGGAHGRPVRLHLRERAAAPAVRRWAAIGMAWATTRGRWAGTS